jgi:hypothetical protein
MASHDNEKIRREIVDRITDPANQRKFGSGPPAAAEPQNELTNEQLIEQAIANAEKFAGTTLTGNMRSAVRVSLDGYTLSPKTRR